MKKLLPLLLFPIFFAACSGGRYEETRTTTTANTVAVSAPAGESAPVANGNAGAVPLDDPSRKIIKTADLRIEVADLYTATTGIERITRMTGGQIASSRMENRESRSHEVRHGRDSLRIVKTYVPQAFLTLKVPVAQLDTVLSVVGAQASFIDERRLQLDDVTLRYLGNQLRTEALQSVSESSRAGSLARRTGEAVAADEYRDQRADRVISQRIENLSLNDQVAYATLTVELYQPVQIVQRMVPDVPQLLEPGLGQRFGGALSTGWSILQVLLVGIISIWPLVLAALAAWLGWRWWQRKGLRA